MIVYYHPVWFLSIARFLGENYKTYWPTWLSLNIRLEPSKKRELLERHTDIRDANRTQRSSSTASLMSLLVYDCTVQRGFRAMSSSPLPRRYLHNNNKNDTITSSNQSEWDRNGKPVYLMQILADGQRNKIKLGPKTLGIKIKIRLDKDYKVAESIITASHIVYGLRAFRSNSRRPSCE